MAYNNGYAGPFQPMYYTPPQYSPQPMPAQPSQQQQNNGITWVSGEAGAKAYLVAPNTTVQLWDSDAQVIYLKSADASGMPSMKVLDYTIRETGKTGPGTGLMAQQANMPDYATKDEIQALTEQITVLKSKVDSMTKRRKEAYDDE